MLINKTCFLVLFILFATHHVAGSEYVMTEVLKQFVEATNNKQNPNFEKEQSSNTNNTQSGTGISRSGSSIPPQNLTSQNTPQITNADLDTHKSLTNYLFSIDLTSFLYKITKVIFIVMCSYFLWYVLSHIIQGYLKKIRIFKKVSVHSSANTQSMIKTIIPIVKSIVHWTLIILTGLMVINVFIDITPLFFGIGIVGVALTIGSQTLMKDLVNGILLIFDGNISVGDAVTIGDKTGTVESISLRALLLRHFTGELQTIPLSEVTALINCSRDYSVAVVEFVVDPKALVPSIQLAIDATFESIKRDHKFGNYIIGDLSSLGVKKMSENGVTMKVTVPIKPDPKKEFLSEFNRRLYEHLQMNDVPLAYTRV